MFGNLKEKSRFTVSLEKSEDLATFGPCFHVQQLGWCQVANAIFTWQACSSVPWFHLALFHHLCVSDP